MSHLAAITIAYNDGPYIKAVVEGLKGFVDSHHIVEGAFQKTIQCGYPPRSDDGTLEILTDYAESGVIELECHNADYDPQQRQYALDMAIRAGADWVLIVDSDEVYDKDSIENLCGLIRGGPHFNSYKIPCRTFVNNFWTWHRGEMPRLFKVNKDSKFVGDNFIDSFQVKGVLNPSAVCYYHYSYVKTPKDFNCKFDHLQANDPRFDRSRYRIEDGLYIVATDGNGFYPFDGEHPEIMRSHPKYTPKPSPNNMWEILNKKAGINGLQPVKWGT